MFLDDVVKDVLKKNSIEVKSLKARLTAECAPYLKGVLNKKAATATPEVISQIVDETLHLISKNNPSDAEIATIQWLKGEKKKAISQGLYLTGKELKKSKEWKCDTDLGKEIKAFIDERGIALSTLGSKIGVSGNVAKRMITETSPVKYSVIMALIAYATGAFGEHRFDKYTDEKLYKENSCGDKIMFRRKDHYKFRTKKNAKKEATEQNPSDFKQGTLDGDSEPLPAKNDRSHKGFRPIPQMKRELERQMAKRELYYTELEFVVKGVLKGLESREQPQLAVTLPRVAVLKQLLAAGDQFKNTGIYEPLTDEQKKYFKETP